MCVDCRQEAGIDNANHADALMQLLIEHRDVLAAITALAEDAWSFELSVNGHYVLPHFFRLHAGHTLRPLSEYGTFDTTCGRDFVCPTCGEWVRCEGQEHWLSRRDEHYHTDGKYGYHWEKSGT